MMNSNYGCICQQSTTVDGPITIFNDTDSAIWWPTFDRRSKHIIRPGQEERYYLSQLIDMMGYDTVRLNKGDPTTMRSTPCEVLRVDRGFVPSRILASQLCGR